MLAVCIIISLICLYFLFPTIKSKFSSEPVLCFGAGPYKIPCEYDNIDKAKSILKELDDNGKKLIKHLQKEFPNSYITKNLTARYNTSALRERSKYEENDTSYTINKGEVLSMCIRKEDGTFHDINLLMYVYLHELAHVAENAEQHTDIFWQTYVFLMQEASKIGIYVPVDYSLHPETYCDKIPLTFNLYFNN